MSGTGEDWWWLGFTLMPVVGTMAEVAVDRLRKRFRRSADGAVHAGDTHGSRVRLTIWDAQGRVSAEWETGLAPALRAGGCDECGR